MIKQNITLTKLWPNVFLRYVAVIVSGLWHPCRLCDTGNNKKLGFRSVFYRGMVTPCLKPCVFYCHDKHILHTSDAHLANVNVWAPGGENRGERHAQSRPNTHDGRQKRGQQSWQMTNVNILLKEYEYTQQTTLIQATAGGTHCTVSWVRIWVSFH